MNYKLTKEQKIIDKTFNSIPARTELFFMDIDHIFWYIAKKDPRTKCLEKCGNMPVLILSYWYKDEAAILIENGLIRALEAYKEGVPILDIIADDEEYCKNYEIEANDFIEDYGEPLKKNI